MELTKNHREALINELEKAQQDAEIQEACMIKQGEDDMAKWFEISLFLATERIKLIKKSLTDNYIDY